MKFVYFLVALSLAGCNWQVKPASPPPTPIVIVTPKDADDCQRAEDRIHSLSCTRADGTPRWLTPKGIPFAEYCREAIADGRSPRPECIATVATCEDVNKAYATPEGTACPTY
jgi:hypothetical protein